MTQTKIWAHRGVSTKYIENTIQAFEQAISDGADGIELDVQRTQDGQLVVYHDENLKRLSGVDKFLWQFTWAELQEIDLHSIGDEAKIPLLSEVLSLFKETDLLVNIELKNSLNFYLGMEEEVFQLVSEMGMLNQVLFSSFNHESMHKMAQLAGGERCAILTQDVQYEPWNYAKSIGVNVLHPMINSLQQPGYIEESHKQGFKVNVWTANEDVHIYAAFLLGVDAIMTDEPEKAVQLRNQFHTDGGQEALETVKKLGLFL